MDSIRRQREIENMERVWKIVTHPFYVENQKKNEAAERTRIFCKHNMEHFIEVARLAYIFKLEQQYPVEKELIYAAAFLHDIGKWKQSEFGIPHEKASAEIADVILQDTMFSEEERKEILDAIIGHRRGDGSGYLAEILYDADKMSRACYTCKVREQCNWSEEKKNYKIGW